MARPSKQFVAEFRWKSATGIGPEQHWETLNLPSLAAAKRAAKQMIGSSPKHTWLSSVDAVPPQPAPTEPNSDPETL